MLNSKLSVIIGVLTSTVAMSASAGLFDRSGSGKSCDCAEQCQPYHCGPTIARPCHVNVFTYQRKCSNLAARCGSHCGKSTCCAPDGCSPCSVVSTCVDSGRQAQCSVPSGCNSGDLCVAADCGQTCCSSECFCLHKGKCCSQENCRDIARLIYESMTACYARDRQSAVHRLGDRYDCCCHPEIMNAFIYALNDSDERVRSKAADEIGDQIRRKRCCCGSPVISALTHALADCDRSVRRQAEEALQLSGYKIVDGHRQAYCVGPQSANKWSVWQSKSKVSKSADTIAALTTKIEHSYDAPVPTDEVKTISDERPDTEQTTPATVQSIDLNLLSPSAPFEGPVEDVPPPPPVTQIEDTSGSQRRTKAVTDSSEEPNAYFPSRLHDLNLRKKRSRLSTLLGLQRKSVE